MNKISDTDAAYIAGIIDGEGCVSVNKRKSAQVSNGAFYSPEINVSMTDKDVIYWLKETSGVGRINTRPGKKPNHRTQYVWSVCGIDAGNLALRVSQYLKVKLPQAANLAVLASLRGTKFYKGRPKTQQQWSAEEMLHKISRSLNSRGKEQMPDCVWGEP